ncbi:hypothetical protein HDR60_03290 [bacterium]|nr:hypothetical protein [bacterium]
MEKASFSEVEDYIESLYNKKKKAKRYRRSVNGQDVFAVIMTVWFSLCIAVIIFAIIMMFLCE